MPKKKPRQLNFDIDEDIYEQLHMRKIRRGVTIKDQVNAILRRHLAAREKAAGGRRNDDAK